MGTKDTIRKQLKQERGLLSESFIKNASENLRDQLLAQNFYKEHQCILIYASLNHEISLYEFMESALKDQKSLYFPKTMADGSMKFYRVLSKDQLFPGNFSVMEPDGSTEEFSEEKGLILVPGLAFNKSNHRIGYGKGYYDKYLSLHKGLYKVGVGYHFQMNSDFEESEFDVPLDELFSELGKE